MVTNVIFYMVAFLSVVSAAGVVFSRNVVRSALFLIMNLLTVAGLYILLSSELLALVQVLVYGGAVTILLIFALMLTRSGDMARSLDGSQKPLALVAGVILAALLIFAVTRSAWPAVAGAPFARSIQDVGAQMFSVWLLPFEVASLVLLVALVGAVVIARTEDEE